MKIIPEPGHVYHFAGGTINQTGVPAEYETMTGKPFGYCGNTVWVDLPGTRGWTFSKNGIIAALTQAQKERRGLSLSIGFAKTAITKFGEAEDAAVAAGTYDPQLKELAAVFIQFAKVPVMLRIGNEVNGSWQGHHAGKPWKDCYRRFVDTLRTAGVKNVTYCLCFEPHGSDPFKADGTSDWWPGAEYVDWIGLDLFHSNTFAGLVQANAALTVQEQRSKSVLDYAKANNKPVFLAETAMAECDPKTDLATGLAVYLKWMDPWFAMLVKYPQIKAFAIMPVDWSKAGGADFAVWGNARFQDNPVLWGRWMSFLTMKGAGYGLIHLPQFQAAYGL